MGVTIDSYKDIVKGILEHIGFAHWTIDTYSNTYDSGYSVIMTRSLNVNTIDIRDKEALISKVRVIADEIRNSPLVKEELSKLQSELSYQMDVQIKDKAEIERLKPYEAYYKQHFLMTHGKALE